MIRRRKQLVQINWVLILPSITTGLRIPRCTNFGCSVFPYIDLFVAGCHKIKTDRHKQIFQKALTLNKHEHCMFQNQNAALVFLYYSISEGNGLSSGNFQFNFYFIMPVMPDNAAFVSAVLLCAAVTGETDIFTAPKAAPSGKEWISIFIQTNVKIDWWFYAANMQSCKCEPVYISHGGRPATHRV